MTASSTAAHDGSRPAATWQPDQFLDRYEVLTLPLGPDPDGEDPITATLVRKAGPEPSTNGAVLYVHGFTDYFFHEPLADYFHARGYAFYALDLRKCGRSLQPQHTAHLTTDLRQYDEELGRALDVVVDETAGDDGRARVIVAAHSTGGIITPLWLDRLRSSSRERHAHVAGLLLNSPWFDLQGSPVLRTPPVSALLRVLAAVRPKAVLPQELSEGYGRSIHETTGGEWAYDLALKPMGGFPVTFGFLNAVRRGHARLHRGIDVGVPSLVLRSDKTLFDGARPSSVDDADVVLDARHMSRWSGCLGDRVSVVPIADARHDVFLSVRHAREHAYREIDLWLQDTLGAPATPVDTPSDATSDTPSGRA
ncbi:alpha/beta hydrolase [Gordonia sp. PKS22-38]|uniref:Alpha/beta hydrolase n=1 Tax=Gordonia prachuapensis TaxID=3115651 RepID=A0ABU7MR70_9ACTN|nr:alpha/beta hydrolase [Gordonia sp. PKS22-38]